MAIAQRRPHSTRMGGRGVLHKKLRQLLTPSPMPAMPAPMLCTLVREPFENPSWIFEPKFDGLRILARFDGRNMELLSRNNKDQSFQFPDISEAVRTSMKGPGIVDGEIVCFDERGLSSFRALQQRFHLTRAEDVETRMKKHPASVYLFDILHADGFDVTGLPLCERKPVLKQMVRWSDRVRWTLAHEGNPLRFWEKACREGSEGIVGKQRESRYEPGRSGWWVKIKCLGRQEFVVGGFTDPQRSRVGLGSLLVGYYDGQSRLRYAGKLVQATRGRCCSIFAGC